MICTPSLVPLQFYTALKGEKKNQISNISRGKKGNERRNIKSYTEIITVALAHGKPASLKTF